MEMSLEKMNICKMLDDMGIEEATELIQYWIDTREGVKGYCRT